MRLRTKTTKSLICYLLMTGMVLTTPLSYVSADEIGDLQEEGIVVTASPTDGEENDITKDDTEDIVLDNIEEDTYNSPKTDSTGNYNYEILADGSVEIVLYVGAEREVVVPATLDGMKVVGIGDFAFDEYFVEKLTISEGIKYISEGAFEDCPYLEEIHLPASLEKIDNFAFNLCYSISDVYYAGTSSQWDDINIGPDNQNLVNANIHCAPGKDDIPIDEENFPDENFRKYIEDNYDTDRTKGYLSPAEIEAATSMTLDGVTEIDGIEYFTNLQSFTSYGGLEYVYFIDNTELETVEIYNSDIRNLDLSNKTMLKYVTCFGNDNLDNLDFMGCKKLEELTVQHNKSLETLFVNDNINLKKLYANDNKLDDIDTGYNPDLEELDVSNNLLTEIDVSDNTKLKKLSVYNSTGSDYDEEYHNSILEIDASNNKALEELYCGNIELKELHLPTDSNLKILECNNNELTQLDISNCPKLESLWCVNNHIKTLDISKNLNIMKMQDCGESHDKAFAYEGFLWTTYRGTGWFYRVCDFEIPDEGTPYVKKAYIDVDLEGFFEVGNDWWYFKYGSVDNTANGYIHGKINGVEADYFVKNGKAILDYKNDIPIDEKHFPDVNFRKYVSDNFDTDDNKGILSVDEREAVDTITISQVNDATGILYFPNLKSFTAIYSLGSIDLSSNPELVSVYITNTNITSIDLSKNSKLKKVKCLWNYSLQSVNVNGCTELEELSVAQNKEITSIDVSTNTNLKKLYAYENKISQIDVSANSELEELNLYNNLLTDIDVSKNAKLKSLSVFNRTEHYFDEASHNAIESIDVTYNPELEELFCGNIGLKDLNISNNSNLKTLQCYNNELTELDTSNKPALKSLDITNNDIESIDVSDSTELWNLCCDNNKLTTLNIDNCTKLEQLRCLDNPLNNLDITNNPILIDQQVYNESYKSTFAYEGYLKTTYKDNTGWFYRVCNTTISDEGYSFVTDAYIDESLNGFVEIDSDWYYFKNGCMDDTLSGPASGTIDGSKAWYYIIDGKVDFSHKGFEKVGSSWMYFSNGKVDKTINADHYGSFYGTIDGVGGWYVVKAGKAYPDYNGFALVGSSWMQYKNGQVDKSYTGTLNVNINGTKKWYYINKGKAILDYTGFGKIGSSWMYMKKGEVNKTVTGIITGTVNGTKAQWYVKSGKVQLSYSGTYKKNGKTYTIKKGKVVSVK